MQYPPQRPVNCVCMACSRESTGVLNPSRLPHACESRSSERSTCPCWKSARFGATPAARSRHRTWPTHHHPVVSLLMIHAFWQRRHPSRPTAARAVRVRRAPRLAPSVSAAAAASPHVSASWTGDRRHGGAGPVRSVGALARGARALDRSERLTVAPTGTRIVAADMRAGGCAPSGARDQSDWQCTSRVGPLTQHALPSCPCLRTVKR